MLIVFNVCVCVCVCSFLSPAVFVSLPFVVFCRNRLFFVGVAVIQVCVCCVCARALVYGRAVHVCCLCLCMQRQRCMSGKIDVVFVPLVGFSESSRSILAFRPPAHNARDDWFVFCRGRISERRSAIAANDVGIRTVCCGFGLGSHFGSSLILVRVLAQLLIVNT